MPAPGLPIPELWDAIISHVRDPYETDPEKDLKAISLVCSSFCAPAQRALFDGEQRHIAKELAAVKAARLADILEDAPHLLRYIRDLSIGTDDPECFRIAAAIPWSQQLHSLEFRNLSLATLEGCSDGVARLLGINSIRDLSLQGHGDCIDFEAVFSYCSSSIETLRLSFLHWPLPESPVTFSGRAIRGTPRPAIRELSLPDYPSQFMDILGEAFDFSGLETLELGLDEGARLAPFLSRYCSTVKCLFIRNRDSGWTEFDPVIHLPALAQIQVVISTLDSFINFLANVTTNNHIELVKILFPVTSDNTKNLRKDIPVDTARRFEDVVLHPGRLPALRVVQMKVHLFHMLHGIPVDIIRELFPRLREKGILEVAGSGNPKDVREVVANPTFLPQLRDRISMMESQ
ncbi:hypothetical protein R3P38DRAFT_415911 [Favolaschia claudopus]|uniref:F-box domain-containing protein n=1 Tax=Favolaschia claudopus TaxID=2862362 RepID=A0AAV9ZI20_9AGAR